MSNVKICVSQRIDVASKMLLDSSVYSNIRCGAIYDQRKPEDYDYIAGDDFGDNVSQKRNQLCELTVQYWAWKNLDADYYGLCHYRRFLSFADEFDEESVDENGQIREKCFNDASIRKHSLDDDEKIKTFVEKYDVIYGKSFDITKKNTPMGLKNNVREHWLGWEGTLIDKGTLDSLRTLIKEMYPQYLAAFDLYMCSGQYIGYNCYIMKKQYFYEMCKFQFDILFKLENKLDTTLYSETMNRTLGFMGEILYATYLTYLQKEETVKLMQLPIVFYEYTKKQEVLYPAFKNNNIPIVVMSSNYYVPYLGVFLESLKHQTVETNNYDIIVLEKEISDANIDRLNKIVDNKKNISLRFFNPCYEIGNAKFYIAHQVYAEEAYYRMLTPWILLNYEKAIVMDCDIIVQRDLADLYNVELGNNLAGGVPDVAFQGILNGEVPGTYEYVKNEMEMDNPYEYINTGVLLLNLCEFRRQYKEEQILKIAQTKKFRIQEQDILNVILENKIIKLPINWNYYVPVSEFLKNSIERAPMQALDDYKKAGETPYLVHFAGVPKPWTNPDTLRGELWWEYARRTDFYEVLIGRMISPLYSDVHRLNDELNYYRLIYEKKTNLFDKMDTSIPQESLLRKVVRLLIPKETKRRNRVFNLMKKIRV